MDNPRLRKRLVYGALLLVGFALAISIYFLFLQPPARVRVTDTNTDSSRSAPALELLPALPQHPLIKVYMNQSGANSYTDPYRNKTRLGDNFEQVIIDAIKSAKRSVDVAVQEFRLPAIAQAMIDKRNQGVKVRLIIENTYNRGFSEYTPEEIAKFDERMRRRYEDFLAFADTNGDGKLSREEILQRDTIPMIKSAKLDYIDDTADGSRGSGLMHHKMTIIDQETILTGSANYTMSDVHGDTNNLNTVGNANSFVVIKDRPLARYFTEEFNIMWGDGPGGKTDSLFGTSKPHRPPKNFRVGDTTITVKFSPDRRRVNYALTSNGVIASALRTAKRSIDMALFVFSEPKFGNLLEEKHKQGVKIRALVERRFAYREYATTLDMWGHLSTHDCRHGNKRPWARPITTVGTYNARRGDMLHHKYGLIDRQTVVTGSHNWSMNANYTNDENLIVIRNPVVSAHFDREFERLFSNSTLGPTQRAIERAPKSCDELVAGTRRTAPRRTRRDNPPANARTNRVADESNLGSSNPSSSDAEEDN